MKKFIVLGLLLMVLALLTACGARTPQIVINEIMASNQTGLVDEDGDFEDWIELYNSGSQDINLAGYYLSDDDEDPLKWTFPEVTLKPGEYLIVWASGKDRDAGELHTNFRVNRDGEPISLTMPNGRTLVDHVRAVYIPQDSTYGRMPDGSNEWLYLLIPTPGASNEKSRNNTLADGYFDEPGPQPISFAWLAILGLTVMFIPLFIAFWKKTRR